MIDLLMSWITLCLMLVFSAGLMAFAAMIFWFAWEDYKDDRKRRMA